MTDELVVLDQMPAGRTRRIRLQLVEFSCGWLAVAITNYFISPQLRWHPEFIGILAFVAAIFTAWLALCPRNRLAYRAAGTFAIATILYRVASIAFGARPFADALPIGIVTMIFAGMLARLYWMWWLDRVGLWHSRLRRQSPTRDKAAA